MTDDFGAESRPQGAPGGPGSGNRSDQYGHRDEPVSWVRRGDRLTEKQQRAWDAYRSRYLIAAPLGLARASLEPGWRLDPPTVFGRAVPLIVEVGSGQGENIVAAAKRDPARDYLGVEVYRPGLARTMMWAEHGGVGPANLRLIQADAPEVLAALPTDSVAELWVFFPDPWPKSRHRKRRLVSAGFVAAVARVMVPGGSLRLATDWADYAAHIREVLDAAREFRPVGTGRFEGRALTKFEHKGVKAGREIFDFAYVRGPDN